MTKEPGPPGEEDKIMIDLDVVVDPENHDKEEMKTNVTAQVRIHIANQDYSPCVQVQGPDMDVQAEAQCKEVGEAEVRGQIIQGDRQVGLLLLPSSSSSSFSFTLPLLPPHPIPRTAMQYSWRWSPRRLTRPSCGT